jgi:hypothetical protein
MTYKQQWNSNKTYGNSSSSSYDLQYWKWKEYSITFLHRNQRHLCQALQNEGVWHFVDPEEPTIMNSYDPTKPNFIPENAVWNRIKPDVEKDLLDYENEIMAELESRKNAQPMDSLS